MPFALGLGICSFVIIIFGILISNVKKRHTVNQRIQLDARPARSVAPLDQGRQFNLDRSTVSFVSDTNETISQKDEDYLGLPSYDDVVKEKY